MRNFISLRALLLVALVMTVASACMPNHLKKYQEPASTTALHEPQTDVALIGKESDETNGEQPAVEASKPVPVETAKTQATIVAVAKDTYRFNLPGDQVWEALM